MMFLSFIPLYLALCLVTWIIIIIIIIIMCLVTLYECIYVTNSRLSLRSGVENFFTATSVVLYVHSPFYLVAIKLSEREAIHGRIGKHPIHACIVCRITTGVLYCYSHYYCNHPHRRRPTDGVNL
jgi:hypothetical protein